MRCSRKSGRSWTWRVARRRATRRAAEIADSYRARIVLGSEVVASMTEA